MIKRFAFLLLMTCSLHAANTYKTTMVFTNTPADGDTVTIAGVTTTFRTSPSGATESARGASAQQAADNLVVHWALYPPSTRISMAQLNTNVVLTGQADFVYAASKAGNWGTLTLTIVPLNSFTHTSPLSDNAARTNIVSDLIASIPLYATNTLPASTAALSHFANDATTQTLAGDKDWIGMNTISNALSEFVLGAITNAELRTAFMRYYGSTTNVGIPVKDNSGVISYRLMPDTAGRLSLYMPDATTPATFVPSAWNVLSAGNADNRYPQLAAANEMLAIQTFDALTHHDGGITIAYNAATKAVLTNVSLYATTNLFVTNFYPMGPINGTSSVPTIKVENSTGVSGTSNYGRSLRWRVNDNGSIEEATFDTDGNSAVFFKFWPNNPGTASFVQQFPLGTVKANQLAVDGISTFSGVAGFVGVIGVGDTNITVPTGITKGIVVTNGAAASADPANGFAVWSEGGKPKYRGSTDGSGGNNYLHNIGTSATGSGSDQNLTTSYADLSFGVSPTMPLPTAGTFLLMATVTFQGDGANANDDLFGKLYNSTDASDISGTERQIGNIPAVASKRAGMCLQTVATFSAAKTITVRVKNATGSRGTAISTQTTLTYVRLF